MKRLLLFISIMACHLSLCMGQVKYVPEYVIEGTKGQQIVYDPAGTLLENDINIKCVVYVMRNFWWEAVDVALSQQEGKWVGGFDVPEDAVLVCAKMTAGDKTDWGWPATYASFVLDKNKQNKEGARIGWALLRTPDSGLNLPGMMDDPKAEPLSDEAQVMWFNNEFAQFPQAQPREFGYLVKMLQRVKPGEKNEQLRQNMKSFVEDKRLKLTDQQWSDLYDIAQRTLVDSALALRIKEKEKKAAIRPKKRPQSLEADVIRFRNGNEHWIALVGKLNGQPYEIFTGIVDEDTRSIPRSIDKGWIVKEKDPSTGKSRYDFHFQDKYGYPSVVGGISHMFNKEFWNYAKLISGVLRNGMPIVDVLNLVQGLELDSDSINTWKNGVERALKRYIPDGTRDESGKKCSQCGGSNLVYQEGCLVCLDCGYSKCG